MSCPICNREMKPWIAMPLDAKKNKRTSFADVLRCEGCGLGMAARMPEPHEVAELYDLDSYYTHGESHIQPVPAGLFDKVLMNLAWRVDRARPFDVDAVARKLPPNATVLDIGAGDGELLEAFRQRGFSVLGVDPDAKSREFAGSRGLSVLPGTAETPPAEILGRHFDLVIMSHSLEHCLDPLAAINTVTQLLAPDGFAYVEVPNAGCRHFETFRQCSEMFDAPRHLWFFNYAALRKLTEREGLKVAQTHYNGFTRLFTPSWRNWECEIFSRLARRGLQRDATRHSRLRSMALLAQTAFAGPNRKYDSIGMLLTRAEASTG